MREARRLESGGTRAGTELGVFYLRAGRPADARREFQVVLDAAPNDAQALANYGAALYLLGNVEGARASFGRGLESDPCNFDARHNAILLETAVGRRAALSTLYTAPDECRFTAEQQTSLEVNRNPDPRTP